MSFSKRWSALMGFAGMLCLWQLVVAIGVVPEEYLPGVPAIALALVEHLGSHDFWYGEALTMVRAISGLLVAVLNGVVVAMLAARYSLIDRALSPTVQIMLSLPPAALVPVSIFALGLGWKLFAFIIWFASVWTVYVSSNNALRTSEPVQRDMARTLGYGAWETLWRVRLPSAAPEIFTGVRVAAAGCLMATVAAEMLAGQNGLGFMLYDTAFSLQTPQMFSLLFVVGLNGIAINQLVMMLRGRFVGWHDRLAAMANH